MNLVNFYPKMFTQIIKCFDFIKFQSFMLKSKKKISKSITEEKLSPFKKEW